MGATFRPNRARVEQLTRDHQSNFDDLNRELKRILLTNADKSAVDVRKLMVAASRRYGLEPDHEEIRSLLVKARGGR